MKKETLKELDNLKFFDLARLVCCKMSCGATNTTVNLFIILSEK